MNHGPKPNQQQLGLEGLEIRMLVTIPSNHFQSKKTDDLWNQIFKMIHQGLQGLQGLGIWLLRIPSGFIKHGRLENPRFLNGGWNSYELHLFLWSMASSQPCSMTPEGNVLHDNYNHQLVIYYISVLQSSISLYNPLYIGYMITTSGSFVSLDLPRGIRAGREGRGSGRGSHLWWSRRAQATRSQDAGVRRSGRNIRRPKRGERCRSSGHLLQFANWKMAEIMSYPMKHGDFPW